MAQSDSNGAGNVCFYWDYSKSYMKNCMCVHISVNYKLSRSQTHWMFCLLALFSTFYS